MIFEVELIEMETEWAMVREKESQQISKIWNEEVIENSPLPGYTWWKLEITEANAKRLGWIK